MPQTSISERMSKAYAGQIAGVGLPIFARSHAAEGSAVSAGMPVKRGTLLQTQVEPFAAGDLPSAENFAGFVILDTSRAYDADAIKDGDPLDILRYGSIFLSFTGAVDAGDRVGLTLASGVLTGIAEGVAPGTGVVILPGCRVVETVGATGLAEVEVDLVGLAGAPEIMAEGTLPAFAAGDLVVQDYPAPGAVFDLPATAAASTVTLPAAAHEGTAIEIVADGTKNGHTVQYRDATGPVNLTTALLASKRHQVRAIFLNGVWTALAYTAP